MGKAVAHFSKSKSSGGGSGKEIDRSFIPENANPELTHLNQEIVSHHGDLHKAVEDRIEEGYTGKTTIRKDAVKSITLILSGSHDDMKAIEKAGNLDKWVKANHDFLSERYGSKNIASLYLHRDETTPHLHATIVPLTKDGRLSAKELIGGKAGLRKFQTDYAEEMKPFGLNRGLEGSLAKHEDVKQYYARVNAPLANSIEYSPNMLGMVSEKKVREIVTPLLQKASEQQERLKGFDNMVQVWDRTRKTNQQLTNEKEYYEKVMRDAAEGKISIGQLNAWLIQVGIKKREIQPKIEQKRDRNQGRDNGPKMEM
jgi:hypothetical protein